MSNKPRIGLYPGTFDPITKGHMDIIARAAPLFDRLVIGVAHNTGKDPLFDTETRLAMVRREIGQLNDPVIEVRKFDNLLVNFAEETGASVIVRGLRAVSDFEYEFQMAAMNARLCPDIETIFLPATEGTQYIASRFVKEMARLGADVRVFVSNAIAADLEQRFEADRKQQKTMVEPPKTGLKPRL